MGARFFIAPLLLCAAILCRSSSVDPSDTSSPRVEGLLQPASQLQKAELADCGSVKHIASAQDKCEFVKKHCAGGVSSTRCPSVTRLLMSRLDSASMRQRVGMTCMPVLIIKGEKLLICRLHNLVCQDLLLQRQACRWRGPVLLSGVLCCQCSLVVYITLIAMGCHVSKYIA